MKNMPKILRVASTREDDDTLGEMDIPVLVSVDETRRNRAHVRARADHEQDDEEEGLKIEER